MDSMLDKLAENVSDVDLLLLLLYLRCNLCIFLMWQEFISVCVGSPRLVKKEQWRTYVDYEISLHASVPPALDFLWCRVGLL